MIVVADTSPLNYLIRIGAVDVLKTLYTHVLIPQTVAEELKKEKAPVHVKTWIARPPEWLEVRPDPDFDPSLELLDPGEAAALSLAESLRADAILIDDLAGRTEAERRHLTVTGTLGVLVEAHIAGLLKFDEALEKLRSTNFRISADVERRARQRLSSGTK
jgi:predicted nucleic acid-binding protein